MERTLFKYFWFWLAYSFAGWIYEVALCFIHGEGFVNRGFNFGPYLPIYGFGGLLILVVFYRFKEKLNPIVMCIAISAFAAVIELIATYILDLTGTGFHTLWDYSNRFANFDGRIALWPALKFGLMGCLFIYLFQPQLEKILNKPWRAKYIVTAVVALTILADSVYHIINGSNFAG